MVGKVLWYLLVLCYLPGSQYERTVRGDSNIREAANPLTFHHIEI